MCPLAVTTHSYPRPRQPLIPLSVLTDLMDYEHDCKVKFLTGLAVKKTLKAITLEGVAVR